MKNFAPVILRIGIGIVIMWFGIQQLHNPSGWVGFLPLWTKNMPISQINFIYLNGWFEVCFSTLLIVGFYSRIVAGLLALHMLGIVFSLGYSPTAIRDSAITVALISVFLYGESPWSADEALEKYQNTIKTS